MSLFQCDNCGCKESTAMAFQGIGPYMAEDFDWSGIEERKGKHLCSACGPANFEDGSDTGLGKWHCEFTRIFLPMGQFRTNDKGNLEHKETGNTDLSKYAPSLKEDK